jgi:hypothetical protein
MWREFIYDKEHRVTTEKGKPIERLGRKATGLRAQAYDSGVASIENIRADPGFVTT